VAEAVARGEKLSHVGARAGYTPEHVRRIARAHGVKDTTGRIPPPPRNKSAAALEAGAKLPERPPRQD